MAEDWIYAAESDASTFNLDLATISRQGDVVQSWMRDDIKHPIRDRKTGSVYAHAFSQRYDDCVARKYGLGATVMRNEAGEVVGSMQNPGGWREVSPGSIAESVERVACAATEEPKEKPLLADLTAGSWTSFGLSSDNKFIMYAALDRVVRLDAEHVMVLTRLDYGKPEWVEGLPIRYMLTAVVMDCANRKTASAGIDVFMSPTRRVKALRSKSLDFQSLAPGTFGFVNIDRVCAAAGPAKASSGPGDDGGAAVGTAWLVTKGYLITADHVVIGATSLAVYSNGRKIGRAEIVSEDAANDLAVLKPVGWSPAKLAALPLASHSAPLGKRVFTLGYPEPDTLGQRLKMSAGDISGTTGPHDDAHDLQISAPIQPGNSGGPVLTWDGLVVGVVNSKLTDFVGGEDGPKPELINYAVKAAYVRPMLEDLPDLRNYRLLDLKGGQEQIVAEVGKSVFMVVALHDPE